MAVSPTDDELLILAAITGEVTQRCRFLRRHRLRRIEDEDGRHVRCSRCDFGWDEPRLFRVALGPAGEHALG